MRWTQTLLFALFTLILTSCDYANYFTGSNVKESVSIYIPTDATFEQVMDSLRPHLKDESAFVLMSRLKKYPSLIKKGKYRLEKGETSLQLVNKLRSGNQEEVKVTLKNEPTIYHVAGAGAKNLEADSLSILTAIQNFAKEKGQTEEEIMILFLPETYHFYWGATGDKFVKRMVEEEAKFWNEERTSLLIKSGMSKQELLTLASIVQLESNKPDEQAVVAGLYLNRLKKGMKLQSDPTAKFGYLKATGFKEVIKRVYFKHIRFSSAYNTYKIQGLPPSPVCLPNASAVDAVLSPKKHNYIFMCASIPPRLGYHEFEETEVKHSVNAQKYRQWLNANGVK